MANVTINQLNAIGEDAFSENDLFIVYNTVGNTTLKMTGSQLVSFLNNNTSFLPEGSQQTSLSSYLTELAGRVTALESNNNGEQPQSEGQS